MWIDQLEKQRGAKNVTFHPSVGLASKQKDVQLKGGVRLQFFQPLLLLFLLLPPAQSPPTEKHAEEVCQPLSQAAKTFRGCS